MVEKIYKFFGLPLSLILLVQLFFSIIIIATLLLRIKLGLEHAISLSNLQQYISILSFLAGVFYTLKGIYLIFTAKTSAVWYTGRQLIFRGIIGMVVVLLSHILVQYTASFFGVSITSIGPPRLR